MFRATQNISCNPLLCTKYNQTRQKYCPITPFWQNLGNDSVDGSETGTRSSGSEDHIFSTAAREHKRRRVGVRGESDAHALPAQVPSGGHVHPIVDITLGRRLQHGNLGSRRGRGNLSSREGRGNFGRREGVVDRREGVVDELVVNPRDLYPPGGRCR